MGSRNGNWAANGNLNLGTGKWAGKWKFPYWASTGWNGVSVKVRATRLNGPVGRRLSRVSSRRLTAAFSRGITLVRGRSHD